MKILSKALSKFYEKTVDLCINFTNAKAYFTFSQIIYDYLSTGTGQIQSLMNAVLYMIVYPQELYRSTSITGTNLTINTVYITVSLKGRKKIIFISKITRLAIHPAQENIDNIAYIAPQVFFSMLLIVIVMSQ